MQQREVLEVGRVFRPFGPFDRRADRHDIPLRASRSAVSEASCVPAAKRDADNDIPRLNDQIGRRADPDVDPDWRAGSYRSRGTSHFIANDAVVVAAIPVQPASVAR